MKPAVTGPLAVALTLPTTANAGISEEVEEEEEREGAVSTGAASCASLTAVIAMASREADEETEGTAEVEYTTPVDGEGECEGE